MAVPRALQYEAGKHGFRLSSLQVALPVKVVQLNDKGVQGLGCLPQHRLTEPCKT